MCQSLTDVAPRAFGGVLASSLCPLILVCILLTQTLKINPGKLDIDSFAAEDFELVGYNPHKAIAMKMAV